MKNGKPWDVSLVLFLVLSKCRMGFVFMLVGKIEVNNHFTDFIYIYQAVLYA